LQININEMFRFTLSSFSKVNRNKATRTPSPVVRTGRKPTVNHIRPVSNSPVMGFRFGFRRVPTKFDEI
jgi:hypothetical protein